MTRVSIVTYLNSRPFAYGLMNDSIIGELLLSFDIPSICAQKVIDNTVDIGLVPVATIPSIPNGEIISDYCISADGRVDSVLLLSDVPLHEIKEIVLDSQSRTSVLLARVLADELWGINPSWINESSSGLTGKETTCVVIGDRALALKNSKKYCYDLAAEWKKLTGLPFVFACWVANKKLDHGFINRFNAALQHGVQSIERMADEGVVEQGQLPYLKNSIQFLLNDEKRKAIELFLEKSFAFRV